MPRPFERRSETSDMTVSSSKQSEEVGKLERLRNSHRFKGVMTPEQQETPDHQARTKWQENEHKAMQEGAEERAKQPWRPENGMQLTSEYKHRTQHGFSGALAGTREEALRYWNSLTQAQKERSENSDTYMRLLYAKESTSQSAEASSQNDAGTPRLMREVVELSSSEEEGEGEKVNAHAKRLLKGAKDFEGYRDTHMTTEEVKLSYQVKQKKNRSEIVLKLHARLNRLKVRYDVINENKHLSEEDFDQIWENYKVNAKRTIQSKNRQLSDSDLSDFSA